MGTPTPPAQTEDIRVSESPPHFRDDLLIETHGFRHEFLRDGQAVSSLLVADYEMRVGIASVAMGGIVSVGTKKEYRNRGYSRRVLEHAVPWMQEHEFDCSILFGIDNYYHKFGYAVCLPENRIELRTRDAERATSPLTARPFVEADRPALHALYAANYADLTGSLVRGEDYYWFRKGSGYFVKTEPVVFTDASGEVMAYAVRDATEEHVTISEVGARRPEHHTAVLRWAAERAVALRLENVAFLVPPDSLFAASLGLYDARQTTYFPRNGAGGGHILGMGRLLRLVPFFVKTLPEWTRRAASSPALAAGASLRLETNLGNVILRWTGETMELGTQENTSGVVRLPQERLMPLVMGYLPSELALAWPDVQAQGDITLFHALFPRRLGYFFKTDQF